MPKMLAILVNPKRHVLKKHNLMKRHAKPLYNSFGAQMVQKHTEN